MPIEFNCQQCSSILRVPDEHAGKQAKCPNCSSLNSIPSDSASAPSPYSERPEAAFEPAATHAPEASAYAQPMGNPYMPTTNAHWEPHRGGLILTFGILSIVCNVLGIAGILAWVMGASDLKKIRAGTMDPEGEGTTRAGMITGIIGTVMFGFGLLMFVLYIVFILIVIGGAAASGGL